MKTVAVTGSSGMLGRHIESRLESDSYHVKTFSRNRVKKNGGSQIYDLMNLQHLRPLQFQNHNAFHQ